MYSQEVCDKTFHRISKQEVLTCRPADRCQEISELLDRKLMAGQSFTPKERRHIRSELIICKHDWRYWAERYGWCELDATEGGGYGPLKMWQSQEHALAMIALREETNWASLQKHGFAPGIYGVWHKTRQQGATALLRLITAHRMIFWSKTRAIAASLDEDKVQELYKRDHIWLDNLPMWMRPAIQFDVKNSHLSFEKNKSSLLYQQANQQAGVGTGQQFDVAHMTEISLWEMAERLEFDFLPAMPKAVTTFVGWESTANGAFGFWHDFTENVRNKVQGYEQWFYVFTPWYINDKKNRLPAPDEWVPNEVTVHHAMLIEETSGALIGRTVRPDRNQLYWWESEWKRNKELGTLHLFFTNYPATPEQSFQHMTQSAFPVETIDWMRTQCNPLNAPGIPYIVTDMPVRV